MKAIIPHDDSIECKAIKKARQKSVAKEAKDVVDNVL